MKLRESYGKHRHYSNYSANTPDLVQFLLAKILIQNILTDLFLFHIVIAWYSSCILFCITTVYINVDGYFYLMSNVWHKVSLI